MIAGPHQQHLTPQQMEVQKQMQHQALERAKLRATKPSDRNLPEGLEDCVVGDGVQRYRSLRDVERRLDATMMRKRLDIRDEVDRNIKVRSGD